MNRYLHAIKNSDSQLLTKIYQSYFPQIKIFVIKNSGNTPDAEDVFQDALVSLFRRLQKEDIEIQNTFENYLYGVCKFIWLKRLKQISNVDKHKNLNIVDNEALEEALIEEQKYNLFYENLNQLGSDCKTVLTYYFEKKSFKEIAKLMNYTSDEYARRKKYLCKKELINKIKRTSSYLKLYKK